jgi:hypothetical protein
MNSDDQYTRWTDLDRMPDARSVATYLGELNLCQASR